MDMVKSAFTRTATRHPLLRSRLVRKDGGQLHFELLEKVIVNVYERHDSDWVCRFEENMNIKLGYDDKPLWYIEYLPEYKSKYTNDQYKHSCTLVMTAHHSIVDGVGGRMIMNQVMNDLQSQLKGDIDIQQTFSLPIPPPVENIFGKRSKFDLLLESVLGMVSEYLPGAFVSFVKWCQPSVFRRHSSVQALLSREQKSITVAPTTSIIPLILSKEQTQALQKQCDKHNVTTQAALMAAYFINLDKHASIRGRDATVFTTFNIRDHKDVTFEDMNSHFGLYRAQCIFQLKMLEVYESLWTAAETFHKIVNRDIEKKIRNTIPGNELLTMLSKTDTDSIHDRSCMLASFHECHTFDPVTRYSDWPVRMVEYKCGFADHDMPGCLFNMIHMTFDRQFSVFLMYSTAVMSRDFAAQMGADVKDSLINMAKGL